MSWLKELEQNTSTLFSIASPSTTQETHQHSLGQFSTPLSGLTYLRIDNKVYIVAPNMAVYIPSGIAHSVYKINPKVIIENIYFKESEFTELPKQTKIFNLTKLAKPLITRLCELSQNIDQNKINHLLQVLFDELKENSSSSLYQIILPEDEQLNQIFQTVLSRDDSFSALEDCAKLINMSARTLQRLIKKKLGITFILWRQQINFIKAIELLLLYKKTSIVAYKLGYNSESAFIAMFKKLSGNQLPSKFYQARD